MKAAMGAVATLGAGLSFGAAIREANQLETALAEVSTLMNATPQTMSEIENATRSMAKVYGTSATQQVNAYYQAVSAGMEEGAQATTLVDQANRLATAGLSDTTTTVDALTTAINVYGAENITAAEASDALFVGVQKGKTTVDELAGSIGRVLPFASDLGVSFEETVAATAALTTQGIETNEAITGLRGAFSNILKPSQQAKDAVEAYNEATGESLEFSAAALREKGLEQFLAEIAEASEHSEELLNELFGSIQGGAAIMALTGGGAEALGDNLEEMGRKAGSTDTAFDKVASTTQERLNSAMSTLNDAAITLGQALQAFAAPAMEALASAAEYLADKLPVEQIRAAADAFFEWKGLDELALGLGAIAAAATALAFPLLTLSAAAIAGATYISANWGDLQQRFPGITGAISAAAETAGNVIDGVVQAVRGLSPVADRAVAAVRAAFAGDWQTAWSEAQAAVDDFAAWWDGLALFDGFTVDSVTAELDKIVSAVEDFTGLEIADTDQIRSAVQGLADAFGSFQAAGVAAFTVAVDVVQRFLDGLSASRRVTQIAENLGGAFGALGRGLGSIADAVASGDGNALGMIAEGVGKRWPADFRFWPVASRGYRLATGRMLKQRCQV